LIFFRDEYFQLLNVLKNKFRMLQDMVRTSQKWRFWKGV